MIKRSNGLLMNKFRNIRTHLQTKAEEIPKYRTKQEKVDLKRQHSIYIQVNFNKTSKYLMKVQANLRGSL